MDHWCVGTMAVKLHGQRDYSQVGSRVDKVAFVWSLEAEVAMLVELVVLVAEMVLLGERKKRKLGAKEEKKLLLLLQRVGA